MGGYGADGRYGWYGVYVMERRQVKMPDELWVAIGEAAHAERISRSEWVRRACEKDLSDEPFGKAPKDLVEVPGVGEVRLTDSPRTVHAAMVEATRPERKRVSQSEHDATVEAVFFPEHHVHEFGPLLNGGLRRCECGEIKK